MQAGRLNRRVRFEARADAANVGGVVKADWATVFGPVSARLRPLRGGEEMTAARLGGREVFEVYLRGCAGVRALTSDMRMVDVRDGRTFNVLQPPMNVDERGAEYMLTVERGGVDG